MLFVTARSLSLIWPRATRTYRCSIRCWSTFAIDPSVQKFSLSLARRQPAFVVSSETVKILYEPSKFYALLLDMIRRAKYRIFISSLYIGSSESALVEAIRKALVKSPTLQLYLQLDLNRSTRPGVISTAKVLLPLKEEFVERVHVSFFRSPSLRGILARLVPPRFNEGWGTWHAKIYGVDDEVIISGANLNRSYFTNRQDRYLYIFSQPHLAQYCFDFIRTISSFSYELISASSSRQLTHHSYHHEGYILDWPDPHTHPHHIHQKAESALRRFQSSQHAAHELEPFHDETCLVSRKRSTSSGNDVILFPVIQAGQFNIREEESALASLFQNLHLSSNENSRPLVNLTSGYFGLYEAYQDLVLSNDVDTRIIASAPKANGFYGSKGISGRIPEGYTFLEQKFMGTVRKAGREWASGHGVELSEWEKQGWTYHAKGIWVSPTHTSPPIVTLFGSTNLNSRSAHIDTELSFVMVVPSAPKSADAHRDFPAIEKANETATAIRHQLADEIAHLRAHAVDWKGLHRDVRFLTKIIVAMVKRML